MDAPKRSHDASPKHQSLPKIDANQIPAPVQGRMEDQRRYLQNEYGTCSSDPVPLATTEFVALDQGNCNPRFMRTTLGQVPRTRDLLEDISVPFGVVVQPLARLHPLDAPIPKIADRNPFQCHSCKAYANPWFSTQGGVQKLKCNFCGVYNDTPVGYASEDLCMFPELQYGSIEWAATTEEQIQPPNPMHVVFALDISARSNQSGVISSFCATLLESLDQLAGLRLAIITFDARSVNFYNLNSTLNQPSMLSVCDVEDTFVPFATGLFVDPKEARAQLLRLLDVLPTMASSQNTHTSAAFGAGAKAAVSALQHTGGKLHLFQSSLPTTGPGALKERNYKSMQTFDKERRQLLDPQNSFYPLLAKTCASKNISVDVWLFPQNDYIDVSTLGALPTLTGGDTHYFFNFDPTTAYSRFSHELQQSLLREQGSHALLQLRCSKGIFVQDNHGHFTNTGVNDTVALAGVDADKAICYELMPNGKIDNNSEVYIQCTLIYTERQGERRTRVHNLCLPVSSSINTVFKHADVDAIMNIITKKCITEMSGSTLQDLSESIDCQCIRTLAAFRKYCLPNPSSAQLFLPESLKLLPLLIMSLRKSELIQQETSIKGDALVYLMRKLKGMDVAGTSRYLYPIMTKIHLQPEEENPLPSMERLLYDHLDTFGIYLIDGRGDVQYLWIGAQVSLDRLNELLGVSDLEQLTQPVTTEHPLYRCIQDKVNRSVQQKRPWCPMLCVIRQGHDSEQMLKKVLVEDANDGQSYADHLCTVHRRVLQHLEKEKLDEFIATSSSSYWIGRY